MNGLPHGNRDLGMADDHQCGLKCCIQKWCAGAVGWLAVAVALGQSPSPKFNTVFPPGGQAGSTVEVTITGENLDEIESLRLGIPGAVCKFQQSDTHRFQLSIPVDTPVGVYDVHVVGKNGLSAPRAFTVGTLFEKLELEPNDSLPAAQASDLNSVLNGRIEKGGDQDCIEFVARRGQLVVIECFAERIGSPLRAVLELFDEKQNRIASNRGYFGADPVIAFQVPLDGNYTVKIYDLVFSGSAEHYYRLVMGTGPRTVFTVPAVVPLGKPSRVSLYGWNLNPAEQPLTDEAFATKEHLFDRLDVEIAAEHAQSRWPLPHRLKSTQLALEGFSHVLSGAHWPTFIGVTDVPVIVAGAENHDASQAHPLSIPCEVSGQLAQGDETDWFSLAAKRGEVLYFEAWGQRLQSPCDLDVSVFGTDGEQLLARFSDELVDAGGERFPTSHLDPRGRWVVPQDGEYLVALRNLVGGVSHDPRRIYRLSVRREEPTFDLVALSKSGSTVVNVPRGGRTVLEVLAQRRRGATGSIRVYASELPPGLECPDVWLGPEENHASLVVSASRNVDAFQGSLGLMGESRDVKNRSVRGATVVRSGSPTGWSRLTEQIVFATVGEAPLRATADGHQLRDHHLYGRLQVRYAPGGVLDVLVHVNRQDSRHRAEVKLAGVGLPRQIKNQIAVIPANEDQGYVSFYLPPTLPVGDYSLVIQAETSVAIPGKTEPQSVVVYTNPVHFAIHPPAFYVETTADSPGTIKRGEVVQVKYTTRRLNGFIGKIHCELAQPGKVTEVIGLRGRGVTFVGQTESGALQIVANEDAPLGQQPFLRIYGVGIVEDEVVFHGSCWLPLKIVE